jgi:hypothetical protein
MAVRPSEEAMQYVDDLDWHTLRLGAFHVLAHVGERAVDTREALLTRFHNILFRKIYQDEPTFARFRPYLDPEGFKRIDKRARKVRPNPAAELMPAESETPWFHTVELWQADKRLPARGVGPIAEEHAMRYLDLGNKLGIFTPTNALSERGETLRAFYVADHPGEIDWTDPDPNPLFVDTLASQVILLDALLREDALLPLMMMEFTTDPQAGIATAFQTIGDEQRPELLMRAAQHLYDVLGVEPDIHTALELKRLRKFIDTIAIKKNHLNQALPRMEFAVDLGLIERGGARKGSREPTYRPTLVTQRFATVFAKFRDDPTAAQNALDENFFRSAATTYGISTEQVKSDEELLYWFTRGYKLVKRAAGFTPGRTVAFAGALLALQSGRLIELSAMFEAAYRSARGPYSAYVGFSGGSRFDREFLIRVDDKLECELAKYSTSFRG